jgi:hypothetical protein
MQQEQQLRRRRQLRWMSTHPHLPPLLLTLPLPPPLHRLQPKALPRQSPNPPLERFPSKLHHFHCFFI